MQLISCSRPITLGCFLTQYIPILCQSLLFQITRTSRKKKNHISHYYLYASEMCRILLL